MAVGRPTRSGGDSRDHDPEGAPAASSGLVVVFAVLAVVLSWAPSLALAYRNSWKPILERGTGDTVLLWTAASGPALAAGLLCLLFESERIRTFRLKPPAKWLLVSVALPTLWIGAVIILAGKARLSTWPAPGETIASAIALSISTAATTGLPLALLQELAWRGYLLPRLLHHGKIEASLFVALVWAACASPVLLLARPYGDASHALAVPAFILHLTVLSLFMTWAYCGSRRSAIVCVLLHALLWTLAGELTRPDRMGGMPILVGGRGILGSMFLVLWTWWRYLRGGFDSGEA